MKLKDVLQSVLFIIFISMFVLSMYAHYTPKQVQVIEIKTPVVLVAVEEIVKIGENCTITYSHILSTVSTWTVTNTTAYVIYNWNVVIIYVP